jgi:hypothetical protein
MARRHLLMGDSNARNLRKFTINGHVIINVISAAVLDLHTFGCLQGPMVNKMAWSIILCWYENPVAVEQSTSR